MSTEQIVCQDETNEIVYQNEIIDIVCQADSIEIIETAPINLTLVTQNTGGIYYEFIQSTPAQIWNINHNKGIYLNPEAYSVGGRRINGDVLQISINQVQIIFNTAIAGFAHLS